MKRRLWLLQQEADDPGIDDGRLTLVLHSEIVPPDVTLLVFSSEERATNYAKFEGDSLLPMTFDDFGRKIWPYMYPDGIMSMAIDLTQPIKGKGVLLFLTGMLGSIATETYTPPEGMMVIPGNTGPSSKLDHDWFEDSDENHRLRPPTEDERPHTQTERSMIFVIQALHGLRFKFSCDLEAVDVTDTDWAEIANNMITNVSADRKCLEFSSTLRDLTATLFLGAAQKAVSALADRF